MTNYVGIENCYNVSCTNVVELPKGKSFDDIKDVRVKWIRIEIEFSDTLPQRELYSQTKDIRIEIEFSDGSKSEVIEQSEISPDEFKRVDKIIVDELNSDEFGDKVEPRKTLTI